MENTTTKTQQDAKPCCCCAPPETNTGTVSPNAPWIIGTIKSPIGTIPRVATVLASADRLGTWKARWGIGRMQYRIEPGLYAVGNPTPESLVFLSANYKMSFDHLRSNLDGIDGWIMVLDTKGINVWCAAGKGTFGTQEIVYRIQSVGLDKIVTHRKLILPQLSAPGVQAHLVKKLSSFNVIYGPIRASDIKTFLQNGIKASPQMRRVHFTFHDRTTLIPNDLTGWLKYVLPVAVGFLIISGLHSGGYSFHRMATIGVWSIILILLAYLSGAAITPMLLPWIPGRSFSLKGAWIGLLFALAALALAVTQKVVTETYIGSIAWLFLIPAIASFIAMNFTGSSTYTSLSGVKKEMRIAVPLQIIGASVGLLLWITGRFV